MALLIFLSFSLFNTKFNTSSKSSKFDDNFFLPKFMFWLIFFDGSWISKFGLILLYESSLDIKWTKKIDLLFFAGTVSWCGFEGYSTVDSIDNDSLVIDFFLIIILLIILQYYAILVYKLIKLINLFIEIFLEY